MDICGYHALCLYGLHGSGAATREMMTTLPEKDDGTAQPAVCRVRGQQSRRT